MRRTKLILKPNFQSRCQRGHLDCKEKFHEKIPPEISDFIRVPYILTLEVYPIVQFMSTDSILKLVQCYTELKGCSVKESVKHAESEWLKR